MKKIEKLKLCNISKILEVVSIFILLYACYFNAIKTISLSYIITIAIALIFMIIAFAVKRKCKIMIYLPSISIFIAIVISRIYSINPQNTNRFIIIYLIYMLISFFILELNNWKDILAKTIIVFSAITVIVTIISWISPSWYLQNILPNVYSGSQETIYDLVVYANSYPGIFASTGLNAFFISAGLAVLFSNMLFNNKKRKLKIGVIIFYVVALILTLKRATLVLNIIAIIFILFLNKSNLRKKIKIITILCLAIAVLYFMFPDTFNNVLSRFQADSTEDLLNGRDDLYKFAWNSIEENPFIGFGFGCFSYAYSIANNYSGVSLDTHNEILQIWSETGFFGLLLVFIPMIYVYIISIKKFRKEKDNKNLRSMSLYIQTYFLFYCLVGNPFHDTSIYLIYLLFTLISVKGERKKNEQESVYNNSGI